MSTTMSDLATLQSSPEEAPDATHEVSKNIDVEMTAPLTSVEGISTKSASSASIESEETNNFQSTDDRTEYSKNSRPTAMASSANWRRGDTANEGHHTAMNRNPSQPFDNVDTSTPLSSVQPGPVWPTQNQLRVAYTYGIRREDGTFTGLIPADELSHVDFLRVPVRQGPEGMIVLPPLQVARPERHQGAEEMIPRSLTDSLPKNQPRRPHNDPNYDTQMQIDTIVAASSSSGPSTPSPPRRREKIYCDKWVHEGVCAFTQLGCKYKHEMPMDKVTQLSLGLNHGLPIWYKRANGVQFRPEPQVDTATFPVENRSNVTGGSWRNVASSSGGVSLGTSRIHGNPAGPPRFGPSMFGPIGRPHRQPSNNQFAALDAEFTKAASKDEDNDEVRIWPHGRD